MAAHEGAASKIAIRFGSSSSGSNAAKPSGHHHSRHHHHGSSLGKRHRAHALNPGSGSDEEDEHRAGQFESISGYGQDGAHHADDSSRDRSRSDKDARKRRRTATPEADEEDPVAGTKHDASAEPGLPTQSQPIKYGLTITKGKAGAESRSKVTESANGDRQDEAASEGAGHGDVPKTADEEAIEALLGESSKTRKGPTSAQQEDGDRAPAAEDYKALPVEDFGAHLLRGLGWDGKMRGKTKDVNRHANLTGLGAKGLKGAEDLGSWNQKKDSDRNGRSRPMRLDDYKREEDKKRQRREERHGESHRRERERERERDRDRDRDRDRR